VLRSFEPFPDNYEIFRRNLALNPVRNIHLHTVAISADGRNLKMATNFFNTGGATCNSTSLYYRRVENIHSDTLDQVFDSLGIATCTLLKIDCEGSEYEILLSTGVLSRVEYLSAEFHTNRLLKSQGYSVKQLRRHCREYFDRKKLVFHSCKMSQ